MLVKSPVAVSTSLPGGRDAATNPANIDTCPPTATDDGATPTNRAKLARAEPKGSS